MFVETYIALVLLVLLIPIALVIHGQRAYDRQRRALRLQQRREG